MHRAQLRGRTTREVKCRAVVRVSLTVPVGRIPFAERSAAKSVMRERLGEAESRNSRALRRMFVLFWIYCSVSVVYCSVTVVPTVVLP